MAYQCLGTPVTAYLVITLLTWAAVSVSGITQELSTTAGDTVNIPCPFGEGTLSKILIQWYFNNGIGHPMILDLVNGSITIKAEYANRASLSDNYSTLILREITVADEGTYLCIVDTRKETAASITKTKLNVFSLHPNTLPVISPCTRADESSSCSIHANQPFTLTCTLPNVYPVEDTELIWYRDGKHFSSIHDVTQNGDGTTDISRHITIYATSNFTCNATYRSATGKENTAVAVEAWIIPPTDPPDPPGKNLTRSLIGWKTICGVLVVLLMAFALSHLFLKARGQRSSKTDELNKGRRFFGRDGKEVEEILLDQEEWRPPQASTEKSSKDGTGRRSFRRDGKEVEEILFDQGQRFPTNDELSQVLTLTEERRPPGASGGNGSKDGIESSELTERLTANLPENANVASTEERRPPLASAGKSSKDDSLSSLQSSTAELRNRRTEEPRKQDFDDILSTIARSIHSESDIDSLGMALGLRYPEMERYKALNTIHGQVTDSGTLSMLRHWRNKTKKSEESEKLKIALIRINQHRLANLLKDGMAI